MVVPRVRRSSFSLGYLAIGPLDFDGARRGNVLRGAGYAWTPVCEFLTTPRGRIFSLLEFLLPFKCFFDVSGSLRP